jgi:hypothetical protein
MNDESGLIEKRHLPKKRFSQAEGGMFYSGDA